MVAGFAAVGIGAALGAWLRWGFQVWLNPRMPLFPFGTLAANLVGGYLVGIAPSLLTTLLQARPVHCALSE